MEINVSGRKINVGEALTQHVEGTLNSIADKYFSRTIDGSAVFAKEGHLYRADVALHPNQRIKLKSRGEADDPYIAFENAAEKVEKQLRRYKRRLKNHHNSPGRDVALELANVAVFKAPTDIELEQETEETLFTEDLDTKPVIIAETKREIPLVSVSDAVMLMDLEDTTTFMFRNVKNNSLEVVYRRSDGNIGWISPSTS